MPRGFLDGAEPRALRAFEMMRHRGRRQRAMAIVTLMGAVAGVAVATHALGDDRATTASILDELDRDAAHKALIATQVQRAKDAVERATRFRAAGDESHARIADGLAREEAEAALDLAKAIDAERAADAARLAATDAGVVGERERALLEEGIARNGRLRAEIEELAKPHADAKTSHTAATPAADGGAR
jgi:hypothetical protein